MKAVVYEQEMAPQWDAMVRASRNGTFLHERNFMDYHKDRFTDASLLFFNDKDEPTGLLPANISADNTRISSHAGLTYGGFILMPNTSLTDVKDMMKAAAETYLKMGATQLIYKPIPYIYHRYPTDEDLYWLFRSQAILEARAASSAILLEGDLKEKLWARKTKKKACEALTLHEGTDKLDSFWTIVNEVLSTRHNTRPVHSVEEMKLLCSRFPEHIKLFTVINAEGKVITGSLLFVTETTVHVQYMEAGDEGRQRRALDWLIRQLIAYFAAEGKRYFEFGISTENGGRLLNEGLAYQKEGFGGRTICYDTYAVELNKLYNL